MLTKLRIATWCGNHEVLPTGYAEIGLSPDMKYPVILRRTEEGFSVSCPVLPGCWSQGETEQEALENIESAIQEYLAAVRDSR